MGKLGKCRQRNAFTLIELLIATALISMVCATMFYFALSSTKLISRSAEYAKSLQTVRFVAGRIATDIAQSSGAGAGSGQNKLVIGNISYEFRESKVRREEGSDVYYLTIEGEVRGLKFSYPSSKLIGIEILPKTGGAYHLDVYARN